MKKLIAILLCLSMLAGCAAAAAETAEKTHLATVDVNGVFSLQGRVPDGYRIQEIETTDSSYVAMLTAEDTRLPLLTLSIAFNELFAGVERMNDLDAESLALIEQTFTSEEAVDITYRETAYGTKLMMVKEAEGTVDYVDFYTIYRGYEIEIVLAAGNTDAGLTDEQIQMVVDFLSDLDFASPDDVPAAGA